MKSFALFYLLGTARIAFADVVIIPSDNPEPKNYNSVVPSANSLHDLLRVSTPDIYNDSMRIVSSSYLRDFDKDEVIQTADGFTRSIMDAWAQHQHLVLRPDDVWFAILVQLGFYMSNEKNQEALRQVFVNHQGKEDINVESATAEQMLEAFGKRIQERIKTDWMLKWIEPNFTTTKGDDKLGSHVLLMGLMRAYFSYSWTVACGIPSITLRGEIQDWELLLQKLDRLKHFGTEPIRFGQQLKPVLENFVLSARNPTSEKVRDFWKTPVFRFTRVQGCFSTLHITGWLTTFMFWNENGEMLGGEPGIYPSRDLSKVPIAYTSVDLTIINMHQKHKAILFAGLVGKRRQKGMPKGYLEALRAVNATSVIPANLLQQDASEHGIISPLSGWTILEEKNRSNQLYGRAERLDRRELLNNSDVLMNSSNPPDKYRTDAIWIGSLMCGNPNQSQMGSYGFRTFG